MKIRTLTVVSTLTLVTAWFPASAHAAPDLEVCFAVADDIDPSGGGEGFPDVLIELDVDDLDPDSTERIIGTPGTEHIEAIAFDAAGTLFAADEEEADEGLVGTLDLGDADFTGRAQPVGTGDGTAGEQNLADVDGLSFDPSNGSLWGSVRRKGEADLLIRIDASTGAHVADAFGAGVDYVVIDPIRDELVDIDDLAIDDDGTMFAVANEQGGGDRLVTIDRAAGDTTDVGALGTFDVEGLDFSIHGHLWGSTGNKNDDPSLWRIDPATGDTTRHMGLGEAVDYEALACRPLPATPVRVSVEVGPCVFDDGISLALVAVDIDPAGGATLTISDGDGEVASFTETGSGDLPPGEYTWDATPAPGHEIIGDASGSFTVLSCAPDTVEVALALTTCRNIGGVQLSVLSVSISPSGGATVVITDVLGTVVHTFGGSGGETEITPGAYDYEIIPEEGFGIDGPRTGGIVAEPCPPASVQVELGPCVFPDDGAQVREMTVDVSEPGSVLVTVRRVGGGVVGTFTDDATLDLASGFTYRWNAEPTVTGRELVGETSGEFTVACVLAQVFVGVTCEFDEATETARADVSISLADAATVTLSGPGSFQERFTSSGTSAALSEGTYTWLAEPAGGNTISGAGADGTLEGTVVVDEDTGTCVLSATGASLGGFSTGGWWFLAIGGLLSLVARVRPRALAHSMVAIHLAAALVLSGRRHRMA